jgi:hypothetical protein
MAIDRKKLSLLLTSIALALYALVIPFIRAHGAVTLLHFIMGLMLGLGVTMMLSTFVFRSRKSRCS